MKSMSFVDAVKSVVVENFANFKGRARRSEYWYFALANVLLYFVSLAITSVIPFFGLVYGLIEIALIIPTLAVSVRRLHDIGKSGWFVLLCFIPLVGAIILLVWVCTDSQPGENKWGANPKE